MQAIIDYLTANPLYAIGAVLLLALLVFGAFQKMVKIIILAVLLNVIYYYYLHEQAQTAWDKASDMVEDAAQELNRFKQ